MLKGNKKASRKYRCVRRGAGGTRLWWLPDSTPGHAPQVSLILIDERAKLVSFSWFWIPQDSVIQTVHKDSVFVFVFCFFPLRMQQPKDTNIPSFQIKVNFCLWKIRGRREDRKSPREGTLAFCLVCQCNRFKTQHFSLQADGISVFFLLQGGAAPQGTHRGCSAWLWSLDELTPETSRNHRH